MASGPHGGASTFAIYEMIRGDIDSALKVHAKADRDNTHYLLMEFSPDRLRDVQVDGNHRVSPYLPIVVKRKPIVRGSWHNLGGILVRPSLFKVGTLQLRFSYDHATRLAVYDHNAMWRLSVFGHRNIASLEAVLKPIAAKHSATLDKTTSHPDEMPTGSWEVR